MWMQYIFGNILHHYSNWFGGMNNNPWKVFQASWWMALYGGLTPKRHIAYSNARTVQTLDLGVLLKEVSRKLSNHKYQSTRSYKSKGQKSKKVFSGSAYLKQTQLLSSKVLCWLIFIFIFFLIKLSMLFTYKTKPIKPQPTKDYCVALLVSTLWGLSIEPQDYTWLHL